MHAIAALGQLLATTGTWLLTPEAMAIMRWTLAAIFVWSGCFKLRAPRIAAVALVNFGVTAQVRPRVGLALGAIELLLALGLVAGLELAAAAAAIVLWTFAVTLLLAYARGAAVPCYCFGDEDAPLGPLAIARTTVLAVLATALALASSSRPDVFADLTALVVATALVAASALLGVVSQLRGFSAHEHGALQRLRS